MNLRRYSRREPWMHDDEWKRCLRLRRDLVDTLQSAGIVLNSFHYLRLHDYLIALVQAQRAERVLLEEPAPDGALHPAPPASQLESPAKARDRARKILQELEACMPKVAPAPVKPMGLADRMKPIMQKFKHLEPIYFPVDLAYRMAPAGTPGAPLRFPPIPGDTTTPEYAIDYSLAPVAAPRLHGDDPPAEECTSDPVQAEESTPASEGDAPVEDEPELPAREEMPPPSQPEHADTPTPPLPKPPSRPQPPKVPPPSMRKELPRYVAIVT